jgi:hypothetical protein
MTTSPSTFGTMRRTCAVLFFSTLVIPYGHACRAPPIAQMVTPEQQIAMATNVSVAKVVRATPTSIPNAGGRPSVTYEFDVQERNSSRSFGV